jgi:hypothetical protein
MKKRKMEISLLHICKVEVIDGNKKRGVKFIKGIL